MRNESTYAVISFLIASAMAPAFAQVRCATPKGTVTLAPGKSADTGDGLIAASFFPTSQAKQCVALTNLQGVASWSYCHSGYLFMTRAVQGGTMLMVTNEEFTDYTVFEINLAGTILGSLTESSANSQLTAMGKQTIIDYNHEAMRLPNGYTAVIAHNERLYTDAQGGTTQNPVDIMGDEVLVLDTNWNVVWVWNAFDWLPVKRAAILGETCHPCSNITTGECCPITLASQANDWLHGNSLAYDSTDGNLIMSLRSQDWVIKIDYDNGAGDGHVIWTLGNEDTQGPGSHFTMINTPNIPSPWFSHQHDVEVWVNETPKWLTLFDNGNTRHASDPTADSRGQVLTIDETTMQADIHANVNFSFFAPGYGTSQILDNGNYWWQAGAGGNPDPTRGFEFVPDPATYSGTPVYAVDFADTSYRAFRLNTTTSGF